MKLNWDANFFFPVESKDCIKSASYEYSNLSARRGTQCPLECRSPLRMSTVICLLGEEHNAHWNADYLLENISPEDHDNVVD